LALALVRHFGSIKALSRASIQQLLQFLPRRKAETLVAALSMSRIAESEHARSEAFDSPESVYRACADLKLFNQEVLRVILLNARQSDVQTLTVRKNHSVRVSPRPSGRGSATKEQPLGNYFEVRFRTEKYVVTYFSAESEAKQSDPRKEAAIARAASSPRRVEDLNGRDPRACRERAEAV